MTNSGAPLKRKAVANIENMRRVFSIPEHDQSTLLRIEQAISDNLLGFLKETIVAGEMEPEDLEKDFMASSIPEEPTFVSDHSAFLLDKVVSQSVHTAAPTFIGHMTSSLPYFMMPLSKIMFALNQNTVKIETSKAFTPLESQTIGMLHHAMFKFDQTFYAKWMHHRTQAIGTFTSGGTTANMTGLWVARNRLLGPRGTFEGINQSGLAQGLKEYGFEDLCILVSERGHYSLKKAADVLGIGRKNVIPVPVDSSQRVSIPSLKKLIEKARAEHKGIVAIVGIAGTTETGAVDPLDEIADLCESHKIHFHVDGAWGAPTIFSSTHQGLLKGIERADSIIMDAHKQLYCPVGAGLCLFKDPHALDSIQTFANYIIRQGSRDLGKHTLEGSRPGMALLVHSALHVFGRKGYELLIDQGIANAFEFAKMIKSHADFELLTEPQMNLLTYRYVPKSARALLKASDPLKQKLTNEWLSELTVAIQKSQRDRGKTFVSRTTLPIHTYKNQEITVFRVVLANPLTRRHHLEEVLKEQAEIGEIESRAMRVLERSL